MKKNLSLAFSITISAIFTSVPLQAELLDLTQVPPIVAFDLDGVTSYDATSDTFIMDATPLLMIEIVGGERVDNVFFNPSDDERRTFEINIQVDENGQLVLDQNGKPVASNASHGHHFLLTGVVGSYTGRETEPLLSGNILGFGYKKSQSSNNDVFDFLFEITDGTMRDAYETDNLYVSYTSESSDFTNFESDFGGGAKGNITATTDGVAVPEPSTYALIAGLIVLGFSFVRRQLNK